MSCLEGDCKDVSRDGIGIDTGHYLKTRSNLTSFWKEAKSKVVSKILRLDYLV